MIDANTKIRRSWWTLLPEKNAFTGTAIELVNSVESVLEHVEETRQEETYCLLKADVIFETVGVDYREKLSGAMDALEADYSSKRSLLLTYKGLLEDEDATIDVAQTIADNCVEIHIAASKTMENLDCLLRAGSVVFDDSDALISVH